MIKTIKPDYTGYEPIGDKVLIVLNREDVNEMEMVNGILMPRDAALRGNPMRDSEAMAVGPECKQVRKGDMVRWNKLNGQPFPSGGDDLYFIPENHLVCIIKRAVSPTWERE